MSLVLPYMVTVTEANGETGVRAAREAQPRALRLRAADGVGRSLSLLGLSGDPCIREPLERAAH